MAKKPVILKCAWCGNDFERHLNSQKFCSYACSAASARAKHTEKWNAYKARVGELETENARLQEQNIQLQERLKIESAQPAMGLEMENVRLQGQTTTLKEQNAQLQEQNAELLRRLETASTPSAKALETEISLLREQNIQLQEQLQQSEAVIAGLRKMLANGLNITVCNETTPEDTVSEEPDHEDCAQDAAPAPASAAKTYCSRRSLTVEIAEECGRHAMCFHNGPCSGVELGRNLRAALIDED